MAVFYIDPVGGSDAANGSSWALAWQTMQNGATAARIAPGDEIRIAKSDDPVSLGINATFTKNSSTVTLASALTATIDNMESNYTAATLVTTSLNSNRLEGATSLNITQTAGFTTGKVCHRDLGSSIDFSAYQKISVRLRPTATFAANRIEIHLCSDATGDVPVNTLVVSTSLPGSYWSSVTIDNGAALGTNIRSVSIHYTSDPSTTQLQIDNLIACNDLTHDSLITKVGGDGGFYPIKSIDGTTIVLGSAGHIDGTSVRYRGASSTETVYHQNSFYEVTGSSMNSITDSGTPGSSIRFIGGWDTATTIRDGITWFRSPVSATYTIFNLGSLRDFTELSFVGAAHTGGIGMSANNPSSSEGVVYSDIEIVNTGQPIYLVYLNGAEINRLRAVGASNASTSGSIAGCYLTDFDGLELIGIYGTITLQNSKALRFKNNCAMYSCNMLLGTGLDLIDFGAGDYSYTRLAIGSGHANRIDVANTTSWDTPDRSIAVSQSLEGQETLFIKNYASSDDMHMMVARGPNGFLANDFITERASDRHTASGFAVEINGSSQRTKKRYPLEGFKFYAEAGVAITIKAWVKTSSTYNGTAPQLVVRGEVLAGVPTDQTDTLAVAAGTYDELSVTVTPSETGFLIAYVEANYMQANESFYVDDVSYSV